MLRVPIRDLLNIVGDTSGKSKDLTILGLNPLTHRNSLSMPGFGNLLWYPLVSRRVAQRSLFLVGSSQPQSLAL